MYELYIHITKSTQTLLLYPILGLYQWVFLNLMSLFRSLAHKVM